MSKFILLVLVLAVMVNGFNYRMTLSGKHSTSINWVPVGVPGFGDSINIPVGVIDTIDANTVIGDSGVNTTFDIVDSGKIVIGSGNKLALRGSVLMGPNAGIWLDSGATLLDSGTFKIQYGNNCSLTVKGTQTKKCKISAYNTKNFIWFAATSNGAFHISARSCDFVYGGDGGTNKLFNLTGSGAVTNIKFTKCMFDSCLRWDYSAGAGPDFASTFILDSCDFRRCASSYILVIGTGATYNMTGETRISNCTFVGNSSGSVAFFRWNTTNGVIINIYNNVYQNLQWSVLGTFNFYRNTNRLMTASNEQFSLTGSGKISISDCFWYTNVSNAHGVSMGGTGDVFCANNISIDANVYGYGNHYGLGEGNHTNSRVWRCIMMGGNAVWIRYANAGQTCLISNCTKIRYATNDDFCIDETPMYSGSTAIFKNSILWDTTRSGTTTANRLVNTTLSTIDSAYTYADYNLRWPVGLTGRYGDSVKIRGHALKAIGDSGWGKYDMARNPLFRDTSFTLEKYDKALGGDSTVKHLFSKMLMANGHDTTGRDSVYDSSFAPEILRAKLRMSWRPKNDSLRTAGLLGSGMGAIPWYLSKKDTFTINTIMKGIIDSLSKDFWFSDTVALDSAKIYLKNITTGIIVDSTPLNKAGIIDTLALTGNAGINKYQIFMVGSKQTGFYSDTLPLDSATLSNGSPQVYCVTTITAGTGGTITTPGSGKDSSVCGSAVSITATASAGYRFVSWSASSGVTVASPSSASTTFSHTDSATGSITASFSRVTYAATCAYVRGFGTASFTADSGTIYPLQADSSALWDSSATTIWSATGGAHLSSTSIKNPTVWFSAAGTVTATFYVRNPRIPTPTKPAQGDTVNKNVTWTFNKSIDSAVVLTRYSDSGNTVIGRDTTTANSITKTIADSTTSWYTLKGGTGATWSNQSAIVGFWTGKVSGGGKSKNGWGFSWGFGNWWNRSFR